MGEIFGSNFLEGFFGEEFFEGNSLFTLLKLERNLFVCQDFGFVKILSQWRRKEEEGQEI